MITKASIHCFELNIKLARWEEKLWSEKEIVIPVMELPLVSIILLAAETSGDSHYENQRSFNHTLQEHLWCFAGSLSSVIFLLLSFLSTISSIWLMLFSSYAKNLLNATGFSSWRRMAKHECEYLLLNGDSHDHVIFGRAALWLHGYYLNGVTTFFCSSCSIQIH